MVHLVTTSPFSVPRNSCAKDLTSFAAEAIAMNRQLAQREEDALEEAGQGQPVVIRATSRCLQLSPPSQSKLAQRRQQASLSAAPVVLQTGTWEGERRAHVAACAPASPPQPTCSPVL